MTKNYSQKRISIVVILSVIVATLSLITVGLTNQVFAQESSNLAVHIKSGNAENIDEVHAAKMGLTLANVFQDAGRNVSIFLDVNGVNLAVGESQAGLNETSQLIQSFVTNGGSVYVCPHCLTEAGYTPENLISGVKVADMKEQTMLQILDGDAIVIDY